MKGVEKIHGQQEFYSPFPSSVIYITGLEESMERIPSKEQPLKIAFKCSDGIVRSYLLKYEPKSDVRKESRTIEFINYLNFLLKNNDETYARGIEVPSYYIVPLTKRLSLVEWCESTMTIKNIVEKLWEEKQMKLRLKDLQNICGPIQQTFSDEVWRIVKSAPAVLHDYFFKNFQDISEWYKVSLRYTKTLAFWSCFGYIIGLGDRHADNILLDMRDGSLIFIDYDCIFLKGKYLPVPEIVEFRLTKNIEAPMGVFSSSGIFEFYFLLIAKTLRKSIDDILGALDSFIYDPLLDHNGMVGFDPDLSFETIRQRLSFSGFSNIEAGVKRLIANAKDNKSLKEMYFGWMPHI